MAARRLGLGRLDPDHASFAVMGDEHNDWRDELEAVSHVFREPEREAWRRLAFRRLFVTQGAAFDVMRWFEHTPDERPQCVEDWRFLLAAMVRHCPPGLASVGHLQKLRITTRVVCDMTPGILAGLRQGDPALYKTASWAVWQGICCGTRFDDRFAESNRASGMMHAVKSGFQRNLDRFLMLWPVTSDPLLRMIAIEVAPFWNRWLIWMAEHRPDEYQALRERFGEVPPKGAKP